MDVYLARDLVTFSFLLFWALIAYGAIRGLAKTNAADVQTVWYFCSLAFVMTALAVEWGKGHDAFDAYGYPKGRAGELLATLLDAVSDSRTDFYIIGGALVLLVLPQLLGYLLSGIFGCASTPWFIETGIRFATWCVVKFFVVLAGVVASLALFGPSRFTAKENFGVALIFISSGLAILFLYRKVESVTYWTIARSPKIVQRGVQRTHAWLTRNR